MVVFCVQGPDCDFAGDGTGEAGRDLRWGLPLPPASDAPAGKMGVRGALRVDFELQGVIPAGGEG